MGGDSGDVECPRLRRSALMVDKKLLLFCYFTTFYYLCIIIHSFLVICVLRRETVAQIFLFSRLMLDGAMAAFLSPPTIINTHF